jgi:two-component system cell cycle sensor histidine kinase/response regulator CckA
MFAAENLLNSSRQAVVATGDDGAIVFWNRAAEELYGWTATEAIGRRLAEMLPPGDPLAAESVFETVRAGQPWSGTRRSGPSDGPSSVVLLTASAVRGQDGSADGFVVVSTPLDQFELPQIAAGSEQLYRERGDTFPERIWILNERYETVFASQQVAAMLGYPAGEMLGAPLSRFVAGERRGIDAHPGRPYRAAHSSQAELTLLRRDGTTLVALLETHPLFDGDGAYRGVRAIIIDITERREAEEQARNRETQMRDILTIARIAEWGWDIASDTFEGMPQLWEILQVDSLEGITLTELIAQSIHPEDRERLAEAFQRTRSEGLPLDIECRLRTSSGGELVLHLRGHSVPDQQGKPVRAIGMIQDVTERRQLETRLLQAERVSSLGRLAASVAHEFNNVLMGIQPFVDLLSRRAGTEPTVALAVPRIADAVARGKRITQEMLRFTRIGEPTRTKVNVAAWLQEFEPELSQLAGPAVTVAIDAAPALTMLVDGHQLRQVFANLLVNAQHAMPEGGRVDIRVASDTIRDRNERLVDAVHFFVSDSGVGMPEETLRYIFEPLFTTRKFGGTGLGLAVAAQVIQQHKGHIYAESTQGKGSTFHILIPAGKSPKSATARETAVPRSRRRTTREISRIILIEDDESVGAGLAAILDLDGITVDWVRLGHEAIDRIAANLPDAVILDLGLPDIDGIEVFRQIAERWPKLPVLFSTGHGDETLLHDVLSAHVAYIQKPYELNALMAALDGVLS